MAAHELSRSSNRLTGEDPTMLVQLPNGSDGLPADVGVLHYHGIRGSKLDLDAVG
jgi:hypothetical protein